MKRTIHVAGMTCAHCVNAVTKEVSALPGVVAVAVELRPEGASIVTIDTASPISDQDLVTALDEAGGYQLLDRS